MAARIATRTSPGTKVVPVALLLTLALAVGVWLVPMPFLRADKQDVEVKAIDAVTDDGSKLGTQIAIHDWSALNDPLTAVRADPPIDGEPIGIPPGLETAEETEDESARAEQHLPPLVWRYVGYIRQPNGRTAAVLEIDGSSRFYYVGSEIFDHVDPRQRNVTITEITAEAVTVERAGKKERVEIESSEPSDDPFGEVDDR